MHSIQGSTDLFLMPGDPVTNVRVPRMFNAVFERFGIDAVMVPARVPVRDLAVFLKASFLARNIRGMVIAPPHKPLVISLLDGCGLLGRVAGSVNIVRRMENGELEGDLFDGEGFTTALEHFDIPYRGKRVRFRAAVRTEVSGPGNQAYLWLRVTKAWAFPPSTAFYDDMSDRPITNREWREYEIVGEVPEDAEMIDYGMALVGDGRAWIDAVSVETIQVE